MAVETLAGRNLSVPVVTGTQLEYGGDREREQQGTCNIKGWEASEQAGWTEAWRPGRTGVSLCHRVCPTPWATWNY